FIGFVVFLFLLAIFDLWVGVSHDAVNFLNSAIGSKAATFRTIIIIAAVGVFCGASMSNGMMDIARHGIFRPEQFSFYELMYVFLTVMVADIILLDIFNSLGMPTSTTVSMVFELLGASFALAMVKLSSDTTGLTFADLLNTEKALSVILGIFLSVAIAFFFGAVVQYLSRLLFTFHYAGKMRWKAGLFGGIAITAIIYFMLIKGVRDLSFMTPENKAFVAAHTPYILGGCFIVSTFVMQLLHLCRVNVFKVVVMVGTFSLAMAFAGNDLVNFIGVPLAGFSSYQEYAANGLGDPISFTMEALNEPARTPVIFLIAAGAIMVVSLATSKKAHHVVKTSVDLSRQDTGEEIFGSSRVARNLVRWFSSVSAFVVDITPVKVRRWVNDRFNAEDIQIENGAAFDLVRASVNLVLAGLLIALGTSLKLPLSTTYVTFMVAMGTSLADRAWSRESAVFRITGVLSVIGGWFITAGAAFLLAFIIVLIMYFGGFWAAIAVVVLSIVLLIRSQIVYRRRAKKEKHDDLFYEMLATKDKEQVWTLLHRHILESHSLFLSDAMQIYGSIVDGFLYEDLKPLRKAGSKLQIEKNTLKNNRRKETLGMHRVSRAVAIGKNTWFHLGCNSCEQIMYSLRRMCEPCLEHVDNNFTPLPPSLVEEFVPLKNQIISLFDRALLVLRNGLFEKTIELRADGENLEELLRTKRKVLVENISQDEWKEYISVLYVYLNLLQESQEMLFQLRSLLRTERKLNQA
ncbi:MAG: inorganic phosphate transporter, partial [Porphyromonadaceae bacterium]|nr:inorganic phosphate transporter [Porphyromonadaceae bacterium]